MPFPSQAVWSKYSRLYRGDGTPTPVAATLTTALTGTQNDILFTAQTPGTAGNSITIRYLDPGAETALESVAVVGKAITVTLRSVSAVLSTGDQVKAAILASGAASLLVTAVDAASNDGSGVVTALAATALTGGVSEAGTLVPEVMNLTLPTMQSEFVETTNFETVGPYKEKLPTFIESGEATAEMNYIGNNVTQNQLIADQGDQSLHNFWAEHRNAAGTLLSRVSWAGYVTGFAITNSIREQRKATLKVLVSGPVTFETF